MNVLVFLRRHSPVSNFLKQYGVVQQLQLRNSYSLSWELSPIVWSVLRCCQKTRFWEHIWGTVGMSGKKTMHFTSKLSCKCRHVHTHVMPVPYSTWMYTYMYVYEVGLIWEELVRPVLRCCQQQATERWLHVTKANLVGKCQVFRPQLS